MSPPQTHFLQPQKPVDMQVDITNSHDATQQLGALHESMNVSQATNPAFLDGSVIRGKLEESPGLREMVDAIHVQNEAEEAEEIARRESSPGLPAEEEEEKKEE